MSLAPDAEIWPMSPAQREMGLDVGHNTFRAFTIIVVEM